MYATKEAMLVREHGDFESTIFYKDMRAFGKGFFEFTERAKTEYGVNYINSDATVEGETENHNPIVAYDVEGKRATQEFDMVILAPTLVPSRGAEELAKILEIGINEFKFFESTDSPVDTKMEGIYIAGYCQGPKDIPEAVAQGSAAAARVCEVISEVV
jgi:heterodisulfide reductase subunit A